MSNGKRIVCLLLSGIFLLQGCSPSKEIQYDEKYGMQWYLAENTDDILIEGETDSDGFSKEDIIFDSTINLGILEFWKGSIDADKKLVIALIDSKVDTNHEDLKEHIWKNEAEIPDNGIDDDGNGFVDDYEGWNFYDNSNIVSSSDSDAEHGTHCAGIIAADHNRIGVMGILGNTNVEIMVLPIFENTDEEIKCTHVCEAIRYAKKMGADICNISSVCLDGKKNFEDIIKETGIYIVAAAGNYQDKFFKGLDLGDYPRYPACIELKNVIAVGSVDSHGIKSSFSNYNPFYIDIAAPGEYIYSTLPGNNYGYESGTSASAPIVTGILGAYYYGCADTLDEAAEMLFSNPWVNMELSEEVYDGRIVKFE